MPFEAAVGEFESLRSWPAAKPGECEPIAGRLRRALPAEHVVQVSVIVFVTVEKPDDVGLGAEEDGTVEPAEAKGGSAGLACLDPVCSVRDSLSEGSKRLRHLYRDDLGLIVTETLKMRPGPVAEGFHLQSIPSGTGQAGKHSPDPRGGESRESRAYPHGLQRVYV